MKRIPRLVRIAAGVLVLAFLAIQLVPVQRTNPPVNTQVKWDSPQTQALFDRACADCHSNLTRWPWYTYVAPVSWLVAHDVNEGREKFNISALGSLSASRQGRLGREIGEVIEEGEMPMAIYLPLHPEANLSAAEKTALIQGLQATLAQTMKLGETGVDERTLRKWYGVIDKLNARGFSALTPAEQVWVDTRSLIDSVSNGGLVSYFYNHGADRYDDSLYALKLLGANTIRTQLEQAGTLFPGKTLKTIESRNEVINSWDDDDENMKRFWEEVDRIIFEHKEQLEQKLAQFLTDNGVLEDR